MPVNDHRIVDRKFILAPNVGSRRVHELTTQCSLCKQYFAACSREHYYHGLPRDLLCHNYKLVFTDGACSNNGYGNATSGMGVVMGPVGSEYRWSIPIDDSIDPGGLRTNQRAELLAAIQGLRLIHRQEMMQSKKHSDNSSGAHSNSAHHLCGPLDITFIVVTDSQYVAEGMTAWCPRWKANSWLNSRGTHPVNLDLFRTLDLLIRTLEFTGIKVGFWKIGRKDNHDADLLAKAAISTS
ncbi:ribonuclease H-like domain-containing protein [Armillaria novae-zelandiae]|uniref:ribonuclease H n=1 Tax=Armillaria novae-zelandiae TaxID=153914 RepID=A0AA39UC10_9AGAR|nr:ribonuclease H-like domain-containing protein [Armillaria novae-zelandiae]